ncbi:MAG: TolB family protein, partial [Desulfovibrionaceae bacterium]
GFTLREATARGRASVGVSPDRLDARLAFIRKPLPFRKAKESPQDGQVLVGDVSSYDPPRVVMQDLPMCFNCHTFAADGSAYGLDMDYRGDKGGYALVDPGGDGLIREADVASWNDLPAPGPAEYSMGLFTLLSADGRWAASTVGESSAFIMLDHEDYSQMFYPATGRIALRERATGRTFTLAGADLPEMVQTSPAFSPDGRTLAFARARVDEGLVAAIRAGELLRECPRQTIHEANAKYPFRFDLYTVPVNGGAGGVAEPLAGASGNGMSNYFPRWSPDGRFIAFTRSRTGMVLQPDSELWIVPAEGGEARRMEANTGEMNSWHCWSPDGRWLTFSSKGNSPFTEVWLTHVDETGRSTPALRLFRFSSAAMAAMVPEFVPEAAAGFARLDLADIDRAMGQSMATDGR